MIKIRFLILSICFLLLSIKSEATHYRAGEITYRQISLTIYEITAITYTDPRNTGADRPEIDIDFGDKTISSVARVNGSGEIVNSDPNNLIKKNIYRTTHTYPGPGLYLISMLDQNRIAGIRNINNGQSVDIAFYVESYLNIVAGFGFNQSPVLLLPPIDIGCKFKVFKHNPAAYDPDGDSLSFTLIPPKKGRGEDVENYTTPFFSDSFALDQTNGQVTWSTPQISGPYNIAIKIQEFRKGVLIGFVVRDMQIFINDNCINNPPKLSLVRDTCIEVNQLLRKTITATDVDAGQFITVQSYGGPFVQTNKPATMNPNPGYGMSPVNTQFSWTPSCNAIRYRPHQAVFRATDNHPLDPLSDISYWNIKVIAPAPRNVQIVQDSNGFRLSWNKDSCAMAYGYKIYRKIDSSYWKHAACETGVPAYTGYTLLDTTRGLNNNTYFDNQFGKGLSPLVRYCYLITAMYPPRSENGNIIFSEESESYASDEVCDLILRTKPVITKVSVESTSIDQGKIRVDWLNPNEIDTVDQYPPPYKAQVFRTVYGTTNFQAIGIPKTYLRFADLKEESIIDSLLNTQQNTYNYKVIFYYTKNGQEKLMEESIAAASVYLRIYNSDKSIRLSWNPDVPWNNKEAIIYRKNTLNSFDSIGITSSNNYIDKGLINGLSYCYKIQTLGNYNSNFIPQTIRNFSQEICGSPLDTIKPCAPILQIDTPCKDFSSLKVILNWTYPTNCTNDVQFYKIYWRNNKKENWQLLTTLSANEKSYIDERENLKLTIAGCYAVTAIDSFNNESSFANEKCIDNCPFYILPNVFTPSNGDDYNNEFRPFPYRFITKVDLTIYNRWGQEVFKTENPAINWNGKDMNSKVDCSEGVYYYICDVYESYLEGDKKRTIRGSIQLIR